MAPNVEIETTDPTRVGYFEADDTAFEKPKARKTRRVVKVNTFSMKAELPEKGSWHYNRKKAILEKHPEVRNLYGHNPWSFVIMLIAVAAQTFVGISLANASWLTVLFVSFTLGAYLSWVCMVMGHEGSHGLVFESKALNKLHTFIAFLPVFIGPFGAYWSIEHMYHHQVVVDKMNRYGPQQNPVLKKIFFSLLFINFTSAMYMVTSTIALIRVTKHALLHAVGLEATPYPASFKMRPFVSFPQVANSPWFFVNFAMILVFNLLIYRGFGAVPIVYYFLSNGWCNGLHPLGMRQVQEHYMQRKGQPTNSVYSPFSLLLCNIGFHNEHHDFPAIPWNRLPQLTEIAPEYYKNLFYYTSYTEVFWEFFTNPGIPYTVLLEDEYSAE